MSPSTPPSSRDCHPSHDDTCEEKTVICPVHLTRTTTATPEQFLAALTDFGPGRSQLFGNSHDDELVVHDLGPHHADVTEGANGVWERLYYDWSDPLRIILTTTDSNVWGGSSGYTYTLTPQLDGSTIVDLVVVREGKNVGGRFLGLFLGAVGKQVLGRALDDTIRAIEARSSSSGAARVA